MKASPNSQAAVKPFFRTGGRAVWMAGVAAAALVVAFSAPVQAASGWQYRAVNAKLQTRLLEAMLNDHAAQGWELIQITHNGVAIFKRKL